MSSKLRVFVSSTMKDLGDARRAVAERLRMLNLEPVNAEDMNPDGRSSWDVIRSEIDTSDLFILLSGESYGWIPTTGPGGGEGQSVTHMEAHYANSLRLPILPFFKRLSYDSPRDTHDANARDAFRREVGDWEAGRFRQEFDWIDELSRKVGNTLLDLFQSSLLREMAARPRPRPRFLTGGPRVAFERVPLPEGFVGRDPVLFAGAGVSVSSGLPTAAVMTELFGSRLSLDADGESLLARHRFADVASVLERRFGRAELERTVVQAFDTAQGAVPTAGHLAAVSTFRHIVTTNYDDLFERACLAKDVKYTVRSPHGEIRGAGSEVTIFQVDGWIGFPSALVITEDDAARARKDNQYWDDVASAIGGRPVVIVGHSLRDENARRVLTRRGGGPALYVSLIDDPMDQIVRERFGLATCIASADDFLQSFEAATHASGEQAMNHLACLPTGPFG
ncbi:DUF4062 domain-containing protein [Sinorhizobium sp. RAC02]|uniref:DUF4062 domain-containing protein n=1 Tax=Sinorhizobium sp. RAC02 TaxID=1842534 RepID=UPI00083D3799|nr:DUF4062 domain-containing protein [Sinorhizobium sp. RAC02]AOF91343.1 hypothetical protein BSY16_2269 [Sinorhizobium sp. RAC02]